MYICVPMTAAEWKARASGWGPGGRWGENQAAAEPAGSKEASQAYDVETSQTLLKYGENQAAAEPAGQDGDRGQIKVMPATRGEEKACTLGSQLLQLKLSLSNPL